MSASTSTINLHFMARYMNVSVSDILHLSTKHARARCAEAEPAAACVSYALSACKFVALHTMVCMLLQLRRQ